VSRIVDKDLLEKIQELSREIVVARNDVLESPSQLDENQPHSEGAILGLLTLSFFIALTNLREARVVSVVG